MSKNRIFVKLCNLCCLIPLFFVACDNINTAQILSNAESIVKQYPDSALRLLDSIPLPSLLNERESNLYTLLKIQSSDLSYQDITADTAIFGVKNYYIQNNNIHRAAQASFYSGRVRHEQQDYKQAMEEYLQANDTNKTSI